MTRRPTSARSVPIGSYNYSLKLRSSYDDYPAAANVGSVVLNPVGDEHFADLFGELESPSHSTGNLSGNLEVKANTNEEGGSTDLVIDGAVLPGASIRVAQPDYLVIWGDMDGDLEVTGATYTGLLAMGRLDGSVAVYSGSIDGFVRALASGEDYDANYPGLLGSREYHGDVDCNGTFNMFDVEPFLARVADGCCVCGGCGFMMSGGPGGAGGFSAAAAAALFERYVDAALMDGWTTTIGTLAGKYTGADAEYWSDVLTYLENE